MGAVNERVGCQLNPVCKQLRAREGDTDHRAPAILAHNHTAYLIEDVVKPMLSPVPAELALSDRVWGLARFPLDPRGAV